MRRRASSWVSFVGGEQSGEVCLELAVPRGALGRGAVAVANGPGWVEQDGVADVCDLPGRDEGQRRGAAAGRLALVRDEHVDPADVGLELAPERRRGAAAGR